MGKKRVNKKMAYKLSHKKCFFCGIEDYPVLDSHRLVPGEKDGTYIPSNTLVNCSNCHRRIHAGEIVIDPRKYTYTGGGFVIHFFTEGKEFWVPEAEGYYSVAEKPISGEN
jgi:hypothetical protein